MESKYDSFMYYPDYLQKNLFEILDDIFDFSLHNFRRKILAETEEIIVQLNYSKEIESDLMSQLIYWMIFCKPIEMENKTIYQHYLFRNKTKMRDKPTPVQKVLVNWLFLNPGFYIVESDNSLSGRVYIFRNMLDNRQKLVCVFHTHFQQMQRGDLITGMVMPMADESHSILRGFIRIPAPISKTIVSHIVPHFKKNASSGNYYANPQLYPSLLNITLKQMERGKIV
ncbi:hypothetical protein [Oceanobacillus halophilus]|uniref:DUF4238 domain-containing protein n=1 Tax=Oceanobacillus halophilus TaxID=930130 RepID=A0A495A4H7_9BACI|nr:hypothetical protein [Oceanobacillus halophilus]RKQ33960.1 hypothetical protein D8M06_09060 [Oceanobacillus halophilus]